jgi:pimeloyl-ACP methyl ester carboxylesterase
MRANRQSHTRPTLTGLLIRVALILLAGLIVAVAIDIGRTGGPAAWLARRGLAPLYVAQGDRIDVGGRSLYLDCRGAGSPTVVLEAGMGGTAATWSPVLDGLGGMTRTCAYDRAGLGTSDPAGLHTLADAADDLRGLLDVAGERGPFIHVGHSLGGAYGRVFADRFRDEIVGLVLVDSFDPDLETDWIHPLLGGLGAEYAQRLDGLRATVADVETLDWPTSERQLRATALDRIAIEVLRAARADPRLDAATNRAIGEAWAAAYERLSPGHVRYEIAAGAGHLIQVDRPDLIILAVGRLVDEART